MKKVRYVFAIAMVLAGALAASAREQKVVKQVSFVDFPLPTGLRVLFLTEPDRKSVTIATVVGAGGADDPKGKEGLAHLVEHLWFRSHGANGPSIADRIEAAGGLSNAYTAHDETVYYVTAPRDSLAAMLSLHGELLSKTLEGVTAEDIAVEREVVRNELRQRIESTAPMAVNDTLLSMLFPPEHRYHRPIVGTNASLDAITIEDLRAFVADRYRANRATIAITADLDPALTGAVIKQGLPRTLTGDALGPRPAARVSGKAPDPPEPVLKEKRMKAPVDRTTAYFAWSLPGGWRDDDAAAEIAMNSLASAMTTYLYPDYGGSARAESVGCHLQRMTDASAILCAVEVGPGQDPQRIASKALDGVHLASDVKGDEASYKAAVRRYLSDIFYRSSSARRAIATANYVHFTGRTDRPPKAFTDLQAVTAHSVTRLLQKYVNRKRAVTLIVEPGDTLLPDLAPDRVAARRDAGRAAAPVGQIAKSAAALDVSRISDVTLQNGLRVIVLPHAGTGLARAGISLHGGAYTSDPRGLAWIFVDDWRGEALDASGVWSTSLESDSQIIAIEAPAVLLDKSIGVLWTRVKSTKPRFDRRTHNLIYEIVADREKELLNRPVDRASTELFARLLPGHPLGQRPYDLPALKDLSGKQVDEWIERTYTPKNATLVIVGDVDPGDAQDLAAKHFGGWKEKLSLTGKPPIARLPAPTEPKPGVVVFDRPGAAQVALALGCQLDARDGRSRLAARVAAEAIEAELNAALREASGATYGVQVSSESWDGGTTLLLARSWVATARASDAAKMTLDRIRAAARGTLSPDSLRRAQWSLGRATHARNETNADVYATLLSTLRVGQPLDDLGFEPVWLSKVGVEDVKRVFAPCAGREVVSLVGPEEPLKQKVGSLGLPVEGK